MADKAVYRAYPRAALIGNPSDGFGGMTIAFVFRDFHAEAIIEEADGIRFLPSAIDRSEWGDAEAFRQHVALSGYYGGIRLLKAAFALLLRHAGQEGTQLPERGFQLSYSSNIPQRLGMSGSSAIVIAALRAMAGHYGIVLPPEVLAELAWKAEAQELGIPAGLQDRVAQAFEQPMVMDFALRFANQPGRGSFAPLGHRLRNIYIAYAQRLAEGSEVPHSNLRQRFNAGDPQVIGAIGQWRTLTEEFRQASAAGDIAAMGRCINLNFDLRASVMQVHPGQAAMVEAARSTGASAKFCGSGGAIIGICRDEEELGRLRTAMASIGATVLIPDIVQ